MISVKVQTKHEFDTALDGDIGFDIRASETVLLKPMATATIPTDVRVELPYGVEAQVRPKSGLSSKGVLVHFGTVDTLYRGVIGVNITNLTGKDLLIEENQKIAQLVFKRFENVKIQLVDEIDTNTERGENGFGSTGKF